MACFLITTALEEAWTEDEPVLFLGEWCRLYARRERWSRMNAQVLPYHWNDRDKFEADCDYLREFYERLLEEVAHQLNQTHGRDHEKRYWRILIGPWLMYLAQTLFDRWASIEQAVTCFDLSGTVVLKGNEDGLVPADMAHFKRLIGGDEWNHGIYAAILEQFTNVPCRTRATVDCSLVDHPRAVGPKDRVLDVCSRVASYFTADRDAFFISTYLPFRDELRLHLRFGQVPQLWQRVRPHPVPVDWSRRNWVVATQARTDFEKCALSLIPRQIPTVFLEGYERLVEQTRRLPWPKRPTVIFTSQAMHDTVLMAYTAEKVEQGTPLVYGQHGGVYGVAKFSSGEEHEVSVSDCYLSWGWSSEAQPQVRGVGILKLGKASMRVAKFRERLLLVTLTDSRYSHRLSSESFVMSEGYFDDSFRFAGSLPRAIRKKLLVRLHPGDFGWDQADRWRDQVPDVELDAGIVRMSHLLRGARIAVFNYNSTGYLEALARDIPTVLFVDPGLSPLRDSAVSYFEDLKRVGIFHEGPMSAAAHVAAVWDDVDAWWSSPELQQVRRRFTERYCHLPENLLDRIEEALRDAIVNSDESID